MAATATGWGASASICYEGCLVADAFKLVWDLPQQVDDLWPVANHRLDDMTVFSRSSSFSGSLESKFTEPCMSCQRSWSRWANQLETLQLSSSSSAKAFTTSSSVAGDPSVIVVLNVGSSSLPAPERACDAGKVGCVCGLGRSHPHLWDRLSRNGSQVILTSPAIPLLHEVRQCGPKPSRGGLEVYQCRFPKRPQVRRFRCR